MSKRNVGSNAVDKKEVGQQSRMSYTTPVQRYAS